MACWSWSTITILILTTFFIAGESIPDVHDLLPKYGLPKGLLPDNVKSYSLGDDGTFSVELRSECYVHFGEKLVYYGTHIKGKLLAGTVTGASGIQAKKFFAWVPITGIVAHPQDRTVEFQVGFLSETLSVSLFLDVPVCGSKFNSILAQSI